MIDKSIITEPSEIERESFRIIEKRLENRYFPEEQKDIIKRAIHTTADFDYADNLVFSQGAVEKVLSALKSGAAIVTDTNMALSGINKKVLESVGGAAYCFMADEDVAKEAKKRGITRAAVSVEKAAKLNGDVIFAVGNAPTALISIDRLVKEGKLKPKFIIAAPVGFVNVIESKNLILNGSTPYIVAKGNKGGSNVAAAIVNALLYKIRR
ncbi:MAG: precorrin-8X methylmutase [Candidatus Metalachnospira sp.]|nr:precorrin-8X methylmutase [Candidatus Metalachnospira sp.]